MVNQQNQTNKTKLNNSCPGPWPVFEISNISTNQCIKFSAENAFLALIKFNVKCQISNIFDCHRMSEMFSTDHN